MCEHISWPFFLPPTTWKLVRATDHRAAITVILAGVLGWSVGLGLLEHSGCPAGPRTGGSTGSMTADGRSREL
ncbi:MAG: hypothetical protein FJW35_06700 [Acidobacteria bacterium]|nr:hypothetical protein [Acidobacteriota bacterium]